MAISFSSCDINVFARAALRRSILSKDAQDKWLKDDKRHVNDGVGVMPFYWNGAASGDDGGNNGFVCDVLNVNDAIFCHRAMISRVNYS